MSARVVRDTMGTTVPLSAVGLRTAFQRALEPNEVYMRATATTTLLHRDQEGVVIVNL